MVCLEERERERGSEGQANRERLQHVVPHAKQPRRNIFWLHRLNSCVCKGHWGRAHFNITGCISWQNAMGCDAPFPCLPCTNLVLKQYDACGGLELHLTACTQAFFSSEFQEHPFTVQPSVIVEESCAFSKWLTIAATMT